MVKFRGIEISIVSQLDIRRLPEFAHRTSPIGKFDATSASCYVPTYPGSRIWFEYCLEGPHPPNAAYFFKLFIDGHHITSWDCTEKYGYFGKVSYCLQHGRDSDGDAHARATAVERRAFQFSNREEDGQKLIALNDDCIEIRVYRVEHRQRIRGALDIPTEHLSDQDPGKLKLISGGLVEASRPQRRYKYQLLDPLDAPYARFRFFYRPYEWLESHGLLNSSSIVVDESINSSAVWYDPNFIDLNVESSPSGYGSPDYGHPWVTSSAEHSPDLAPVSNVVLSPPTNANLKIANLVAQLEADSDPVKRHTKTKIAPGDQNDLILENDSSFHDLVTKGSIEELSCNVPRSPQRSKKRGFTLRRDKVPDLRHTIQRPPSHLSRRLFRSAFRSSSRQGKDGDEFEDSVCSIDDDDPNEFSIKTSFTEKIKRPLSPFTSGGFLRRLRSPIPSSDYTIRTPGSEDAGEDDRDLVSSAFMDKHHWDCFEGQPEPRGEKGRLTPNVARDHDHTQEQKRGQKQVFSDFSKPLGNLRKMFGSQRTGLPEEKGF